MKTYEISGTYGSQLTPCTVLVAENRDGSKWYCVEDSKNVNKTWEDLEEGVDVEMVQDADCFTAGKNIFTLEELEAAIND